MPSFPAIEVHFVPDAHLCAASLLLKAVLCDTGQKWEWWDTPVIRQTLRGKCEPTANWVEVDTNVILANNEVDTNVILANNIQSETIAGRVNKVVNTSIGFDINRKGGFTAIYSPDKNSHGQAQEDTYYRCL